jgi:peptidyl-prolyl cis-trans isomerase C
LIDRLGGESPLIDWFAANAYDMESFRRDLRRDMAAAWMRDEIAAGVPDAVEQVHARQILLYNSEDADEVLAQLLAGSDFGELAAAYDPVAAGDLGWFPKGYLLDPALNEAAFQLEPQEISPVIAAPQGYVILQVIERDPARSLEPDARLILQEQALQEWLAASRGESEIEILLP